MVAARSAAIGVSYGTKGQDSSIRIHAFGNNCYNEVEYSLGSLLFKVEYSYEI
jgi:hypothetical protein